MIKTQSKTIDGCEVTVTELPFTRAQDLGIRLIRDLGPVGSDFVFNIEGAQEKLSKTIQDLTSSLSHQNIIEIALELFYNAKLKGPKATSAVSFTKDDGDSNFDAVLMQEGVKKPVFYKAMIFAMEVNYQDFLVGPALKAALGKLKEHVIENLPKSPVPKSSPAGGRGV